MVFVMTVRFVASKHHDDYWEYQRGWRKTHPDYYRKLCEKKRTEAEVVRCDLFFNQLDLGTRFLLT